jgi:dienelactone hydrolase
MVGLAAATASAAPVGKVIEYRAGDTALEGFFVCDNATSGKRPGILIVHEEGGRGVQARLKAEQWAKLGYAAFSIDPYGNGVHPKDAKDAARLLGKDAKALRAKLAAGLAAFAGQPQVDDQWLVAVGYGVGGPAALDLAYTGADLDGVVSVGGEPAPPELPEVKRVRGKVLILLGDDARAATVRSLEDAFRRGGVEAKVLRPAEGPNNPERTRLVESRASDAAKTFVEGLFPRKSAGAKAGAGAPVPGVPAKVLKLLQYVDDKGEAPKGYEGGRNFGNFEGHLAKRDGSGRPIKYREWDVNPLQAGVNRGAERLITGSDGTAYFTDDHYRTFKKIR